MKPMLMFLPRCRSLCVALAALAAAFLAAPRAQAVIVAAGDSDTTYQTDPGGGVPWNNVGSFGGASAVYLGDLQGNGTYWVLTASHIATNLGHIPTKVTFGSDYDVVLDSYVRLQNPEALFPGYEEDADLVMFRIDTASNPAGLLTLDLADSRPTASETLTMVGYDARILNGAIKRWGENQAEGIGNASLYHISTSTGDYRAFATAYTADSPVSPSEAQAVIGDSGGAVFSLDDGTYKLSGLMLAVADDGEGTSFTYAANLASYADQIKSNAVPEPGAFVLWGLGLAGMGLCRFLARRARRKEGRPV